jgi:hypothetical protein
VFVEFHIFFEYNYFLGSVCRAVVAIGSYEDPSLKSESVEARYSDIFLSDLRSVITTSRKSGKAKKSGFEFRFCTGGILSKQEQL